MMKRGWICAALSAAALTGCGNHGDKQTAGSATPAAAAAPTQQPTSVQRGLAFPEGASVGELAVRKVGSENAKDWSVINDAKGKITIPPGYETQLKVSPSAAKDLSALDALKPDDLTEITFEKVPVDAAQLAHLSHLTGLQGLNLNESGVDDKGLAQIKGLTGLKKLSLGKTAITDAGLANIEGMPALERIWLQETEISSAGVAHLKGLKSLNRLMLAKTRIDDGALDHLTGLDSLARLDLNGTNITDAALDKIKAMPGLAEVNLSFTKTSHDAVEKLRADKPNLKIVN